MPPLTREQKEKAIKDALARKQAADAAKAAATPPSVGSKVTSLAGGKTDKHAPSPGLVKLAVKAPAALSATPSDDALPAAAAAKKDKKVVDPNLLTVSDVAREIGVDPKHGRARLRAAGKSAAEGRWPKVTRDSDEHRELIKLMSTEVEAKP